VCIYNKTPMIFVPLLAEQFFWARNYEAMTGTPFVHYQSADHRIVANLLRAWLVERTSPMTTAYLRECGKSMRLNDGSKRVGEIVRAFVAPMKPS
jgi:UDP:flavonoid glycosyltransferase YjiC (YdhE family)